MKNIITANSCRTRNFPKYLFNDKKKENKDHFRVDRTDTLSNPLFIKIIEDNVRAALFLQNVFYEDVQFQHPPNLRGNYWHKDKLNDLLKKYNVTKIECKPPSKYDLGVFEVCSVKYQKPDKNYLNFNDFKSKIKSILKDLTHIQYKNVKQWIDANPDYMDNPENQEYFIDLVRRCSSSLEDIDSKVIKRVCNNVNLRDDVTDD